MPIFWAFIALFTLGYNSHIPSVVQSRTTAYRSPTSAFTYPAGISTVLPNPSSFFSPNLLKSPLPTSTFFQNYVINNGSQQEYIHPYLIKSNLSSLSISYPSIFSNSNITYQIFNADLTISVFNNPNPNRTHVISSFNDLSITLDIQPNLRFFLVRGSPFITCEILKSIKLYISTNHTIHGFVPNSSKTKYKINLDNGQTWILYSSSPIKLTHNKSSILSDEFDGIIRIAVLASSDSGFESVLDTYSSRYPVSGRALFKEQHNVEYKWVKKGSGDLLMLANALHFKLIDKSLVKVLNEFKYQSIDGELVGIVGESWVLKTDPIPVTWYSIKGVEKQSYPQIIKALVQDVNGLNASNISTTSSYFFGKLVARGARMALIAEEIGYPNVIPKIKTFLKGTIEPWLDGTFKGNGFLYEKTWGGLITKQGSNDSTADFGFGIYNDHHFHIGYFLYGIAVLAKIDPIWGNKYRPQAYALMTDFMTLGRVGKSNSNLEYTRVRMFDFWKLHSWAAGLFEFTDGRNQESSSEAVNAYYSAALMGLAYGDTHLYKVGSLLTSMEIHGAQTWWHVKEDSKLYASSYTRENRVTGVLWANKRDSALWWAPREFKECRLGINVLPLSPITEVLFSDVEYVKQLVKWTLPALAREGAAEGWKGMTYALEGLYEQEIALKKIRTLTGHDDGNSLSNMLWWIFSRE
ncbi:glucan endo-1,3-beta-D-glucosidase-like [Rutidosis leptorrhynchoides]|uniref:glucan endo-1,3-beta-D-glucosidase-like n=1 Tax=Rutidosis leptorrhynchoides TaxID=125765 RepID=UPI003A9A021A